MSTETAIHRRCPSCRAAEMEPTVFEQTFTVRRKLIFVSLLSSQCSACGATLTSGSQHNENLKRLEQRRAEYGDLLLGEDIVAFRMRYGITQEAAGKIFGKSKIAFSRYENEWCHPDDSTTKLLRLAIEMPQALKKLADAAGVLIPLWDARCAEERNTKLVRLVTKSASLMPSEFLRSMQRIEVRNADMHRRGTDSSSITFSAEDQRFQPANDEILYAEAYAL